MGLIIGLALWAQHSATEARPPSRSLDHGASLAEFFSQSGDRDWLVVRRIDGDGFAIVRAYPNYRGFAMESVPNEPEGECYLLLRDKVALLEPSQKY